MNKALQKSGRMLLGYGPVMQPGPLYWTAAFTAAKKPYLKACWNFDSSLTGEVSGTGHTLTNSGATSVAGKHGNGASFNGSSSRLYMSAAHADFNLYNSAWTMQFWANPTALSTNMRILLFENTSGDTSGVYISAGPKISIGHFAVDALSASDNLSTGVWTLVTVCRTAAGLTKIYYNATEKASQTYEPFANESKYVHMGYSTNYGGNYYNGLLDEVLVLKGYAMTAEDVAEIYNSGAGRFYGTDLLYPIPVRQVWTPAFYTAIQPSLKACWNFDRNLTRDESGNGRTLTNSGVTAGIGKNNGGAVFNGSSQYMYYADHDDWDFGTGQFLLGGWFKRGGSDVYEMITHGGNGGVVDVAGWSLMSGSSSNLAFYVYQNGSTLLVNISVNGLTLTSGTWYFVMVTRDSSGRFDLWLDGVSIGNATYTPTISYGTSELRLGVSHEGNRYFLGSMDEIVIVKGVAPTAAQMLEYYNEGKGRFYRKRSTIFYLPYWAEGEYPAMDEYEGLY